MKNKLGIFGPYPPPLGGISVHIKRIEFFLKENKIDYTIYNHGNITNTNVVATYKKIIWYFKLLFFKQYKVFHFHQFFIFHFFYYLLYSYLNPSLLIITIHSERILEYNKLTQKSIVFCLRKTKRLQLISVSKNLNIFFKKNRLNSIFLPAYVPPMLVNSNKINSSKDLFLFSVWKFTKKLSHEIYNVPLVFKYLALNKKKFNMLFMIGTKQDSDLEYLNLQIKKYNLEDNIILKFNENLVDNLNSCKFLIRPNLSDGYGVSIQEALDLGVPAIASDVCERPKGAILFKNDNLEELTSKITYVMENNREELIKNRENLTYHKTLLNIYLKSINK